LIIEQTISASSVSRRQLPLPEIPHEVLRPGSAAAGLKVIHVNPAINENRHPPMPIDKSPTYSRLHFRLLEFARSGLFFAAPDPNATD
jgi:hypothetical protein